MALTIVSQSKRYVILVVVVAALQKMGLEHSDFANLGHQTLYGRGRFTVEPSHVCVKEGMSCCAIYKWLD